MAKAKENFFLDVRYVFGASADVLFSFFFQNYIAKFACRLFIIVYKVADVAMYWSHSQEEINYF